MIKQSYGRSKPEFGRKPMDSYVVDFDLRGMWLFNEGFGGTLYDSSPYGSHGVITGVANPPTPTSGWVADGIAFNGSTDSVVIAHQPAQNSTYFTISARYRKRVSAGNQVPVSKVVPGGAGWMFYNNSAANTSFFCYLLGPAFITEAISSYLIQEVIHTAVYKPGFLELYTNGNLQASSAIIGSYVQPTVDMTIGRYDASTYFQGIVSDVRIWGKPMNADQVAKEYGEPYWMFNKPTVYFIPSTGAVSTNTMLWSANF